MRFWGASKQGKSTSCETSVEDHGGCVWTGSPGASKHREGNPTHHCLKSVTRRLFRVVLRGKTTAPREKPNSSLQSRATRSPRSRNSVSNLFKPWGDPSQIPATALASCSFPLSACREPPTERLFFA